MREESQRSRFYKYVLIRHLSDIFGLSCHAKPFACDMQAALLHDTVEDTDTTPEELVDRFGPIVARIVQEVTDDKSLPKQERKRLQVEHAPHCSRQAKLVKLADKLYNLRDLNACTPIGQHLSTLKTKNLYLWKLLLFFFKVNVSDLVHKHFKILNCLQFCSAAQLSSVLKIPSLLPI